MFPFVALHVVFFLSDKKNRLYQDLKRWAVAIDEKDIKTNFDYVSTFYDYMITYPEFRSLFYYRFKWGRVLSFILKPMPNLYIYTKDIGPGLFIQHGFATIISAKEIGRDCWINQQVTIGYSNKTDAPIIGDNVTINAGAKVIGGVHIGSGSKIGAGAVVVKDVPANSVAVGVPARVIKQDGNRVE